MSYKSGLDEIITGIFLSKRYTGQFGDEDEMTEFELNVDIPKRSRQIATSKDSWNDIVHDFDDPDETVINPTDLEGSGQ
jgi:hypothetical protein